jgi:hypothetical protein
MPNIFALTLKAQNSYPGNSVIPSATQQVPDLIVREESLISGVFEAYGSGAVNTLTVNSSFQISSVLNGGTAALLTNPITNATLVFNNLKGFYVTVTRRDPTVAPASVQPTATAPSSSLVIGTGTKTFTTQTGLAYVAGMRVRATDVANAANYMEGTVTSYTTGTGALVMGIDRVGGAGTTVASWTLTGIVCAQLTATDFCGLTMSPAISIRENGSFLYNAASAVKTANGNVLSVFLNGTTGLNVNILVLGS